jgi:hypothetical protein
LPAAAAREEHAAFVVADSTAGVSVVEFVAVAAESVVAVAAAHTELVVVQLTYIPADLENHNSH